MISKIISGGQRGADRAALDLVIKGYSDFLLDIQVLPDLSSGSLHLNQCVTYTDQAT
jgi:hypothetical protein